MVKHNSPYVTTPVGHCEDRAAIDGTRRYYFYMGPEPAAAATESSWGEAPNSFGSAHSGWRRPNPSCYTWRGAPWYDNTVMMD